MEREIYENYVAILRGELVPALGCTEPIAIAYASALARKVLGREAERMDVACSGNIIKNVKSVIVPNSGRQYGVEVDKRKIVLENDIKAFGTYSFDLKFYNGITATMSVVVCEA